MYFVLHLCDVLSWKTHEFSLKYGVFKTLHSVELILFNECVWSGENGDETSLESRLSPVLLTLQPQMGSSNDPLLKFHLCARAAPRTQRNIYLLDYWFTMREGNSRTARWKRCAEQGVRASVLPPGAPVSAPPCIYQPTSSSNPHPLVFL